MAIFFAAMDGMITAMPKLLRAVRLDDSDDSVFRVCGAARDGEPVVSGGFAACDFDRAPQCDPPCHCESSFVAVGSRARCSIAEVVEVGESDFEAQIDALAWHLVRRGTLVGSTGRWRGGGRHTEVPRRRSEGPVRICEGTALEEQYSRSPDGRAHAL